MQDRIEQIRKDLENDLSIQEVEQLNQLQLQHREYTKWPPEKLLIIGCVSGKGRIGFGFSDIPDRLLEPIYGIKGSKDRVVMNCLFQTHEGEFVLGEAQRIGEESPSVGVLTFFLDKAAVLFKKGIVPRPYCELWAISPEKVMYGTKEEINGLSGEKCEVDFKITEFIVNCFEEAEYNYRNSPWTGVGISLFLLKHRLLSLVPFIQRAYAKQKRSQPFPLGSAEQKILDHIREKMKQLLNGNR